MAIDGFFIKNLTNEVKLSINNYRLEKIEQLTDDIFSFSMYLKGDRQFLTFKLKPPHASFFITKNKIYQTQYESNFFNNLKRNLQGYRLIDINQHNLDRVVIFKFNGVDLLKGEINKYLIIELMGRYNNLILTNDDYLIIDAYIKNLSHHSRSIVNNIKYEFFPSNKSLFKVELYNQNNYDPTYYSKNFVGISPLLSKYMFNKQIDIFSEPLKPTKLTRSNKFYWFDLFLEDKEKVYYNSLSKMIEKLITNKGVNKSKYETFIDKEIKKLSNKLVYLKNDLDNAENNLKLKDYGNYIYSSGLDLNQNLSEFKTYDNKIIKLDSSKTMIENAQDYFNKYSKAKRAITYINEQLLETNNLLNLFNQFKYDLINITDDFDELEDELKKFGFKSRRKRNHNKNKTNNYLKIKYLNNTFYVGKNSRQNSYIIDDLSNRNDYWFHIKDIPGSHVLLKGDLTDDTLKIGAMLAKYYSKEKDTPVSTISYTQRKYLKKIPKLPASQVILTKFKTINIKVDTTLLKEIFIANKLKFS